jgi:hypothetical protein
MTIAQILSLSLEAGSVASYYFHNYSGYHEGDEEQYHVEYDCACLHVPYVEFLPAYNFAALQKIDVLVTYYPFT